MNPVLAQAIATLLGALSTAILMAAAYYFGPNRTTNRKGTK